MDDGTRSIGELARESGLTVSALRFYDTADVLRPAYVDPATGYRRYAAEQVSQARLVAALRRVGMPLPDLCAVLAARRNPVEASRLLDHHLDRLEEGLAAARRQLSVARELLDPSEVQPTTLRVDRADLLAALSAVGYAISSDPELPALGGVLFDFDGEALRLVASDRYRLAVSVVALREQRGPAIQVIAPQDVVGALPRSAEVEIRLEGGAVQLGDVRWDAVDAEFPDYRRLLPATTTERMAVTPAEVRERLTAGPSRSMVQAPGEVAHEVSVILLTDDGLQVIEEDRPEAAGFNREFLLEALQAMGGEQLYLALDGPIAPLMISDPDRPGDVGLLMPTRLP